MAGKLEFLTRPSCGLCDEALALLEPMARRVGVAVEVRDAAEAGDGSLLERIPVVRLAGGRELHSGPLSRPRALYCVIRARTSRH